MASLWNILCCETWSGWPGCARSQDPVSLSDKMSYCGISWSLVTVKLEVYIMASLWKLTGTSAALLSRCLSDLRVIIQSRIQISQLRDFARSYNKMSYLILKQGPGLAKPWYWMSLGCCFCEMNLYNNFNMNVVWHSSDNFTWDISANNHWNVLENYLTKISFKSPRSPFY